MDKNTLTQIGTDEKPQMSTDVFFACKQLSVIICFFSSVIICDFYSSVYQKFCPAT